VVFADQGERLDAVSGLSEDLHVLDGVDHDPEATPNERLIVGDHDSDLRWPCPFNHRCGGSLGSGSHGRVVRRGVCRRTAPFARACR
jgi:hypothetical protein